MDRSILLFKDILKERREENSNFMWISRHLNPKVSYKRLMKPSPKFHKEEVLKSKKIQELIEKISNGNIAIKDKMVKEIWIILNEIGFNRRLPVIRWLGLILTKFFIKVFSGIYVSDKIYRIKELMGDKPVIFLPSHRSYADFILTSYLCFTYNIEIPATAAGMDFYSMWGMGTVLRDTGAFFMRRTFNNDNLYWDTFRQYVYQLTTEGDLPLEFFIEGTRSRSGKSLMPKCGLLSMILKMFYTAVVPDILFVPINISYDRVLEEKLFAYELLGVPKPKESTSGLFKSLSILKEHYGKIYVDFGDPISARTFFDSIIDRSSHSIKPVYKQELTEQEKELTLQLANNIIDIQQKCSVITTFNLIALSLIDNFINGKKEIHLSVLKENITWLNNFIKELGAFTELLNVEKNVTEALDVHKGLVKLTDDVNVELVQNEIDLSTSDASKLKGHAFSQETMTYAVPFIMLQIYVNPVMHYLSNASWISLIIKQYGKINKDDLFNKYTYFQTLFSHEFVSNQIGIYEKYEDLLKKLTEIKFLTYDSSHYQILDLKVHNLLKNVMVPFLFTYYIVADTLLQNECIMQEKTIFLTVQSQIEALIKTGESFIHPYCMNLDSITNSLNSFTSMKIVSKEKVNGEVVWHGDVEKLKELIDKIGLYLAPMTSIQKVNRTIVMLPSKL